MCVFGIRSFPVVPSFSQGLTLGLTPFWDENLNGVTTSVSKRERSLSVGAREWIKSLIKSKSREEQLKANSQ